ncbi:uncharacterized protein LOC128317488 [Pangasianodon hypophthalmus]|uniref:uncharacterized protein LOC128317488 n=1 Tax=Pangasianodon hypophthalmus TaxID=310915 RepID=UPI002307374D|nr:uncharacterized protein LOC128317488 [Pangasianodon hypophthalmus]
MNHVRQALVWLLENQLYVKGEKCKFHVPKSSFLGYIISSEDVYMDQDKVTAITNWPVPTTVKELQRFLGFANFYRRYIRGFSNIALPLTSLLKKGPKKLHWNPSANQVFKCHEEAFTSALIHKHPDPSRPFIVEMNTSETGVGAGLSQRVGEKPKLYPVAFKEAITWCAQL